MARKHDIVSSLHASTRVLRAHKRWVACVTPTILRTDVHDRRLGVLGFGLEGGDESVLGIHDDVVHLSPVFEPDGEVHLDYFPLKPFRRGPSAGANSKGRAEVGSGECLELEQPCH